MGQPGADSTRWTSVRPPKSEAVVRPQELGQHFGFFIGEGLNSAGMKDRTQAELLLLR